MTNFRMTNAGDEGEELTFSRVMRVGDLRATATASAAAQDALLQKVKDRALDPSVFDIYKPFFWPGQISSNRWDSYDTRMGPTTLKNYAAEAEAGVAFLRNHDVSQDPVGFTFQGDFTGAQGDGIAHVNAMFYALEDPTTAPYIAKLRAGIVQDLSVGFFGGQWMCSLCNRDMQQWMGPDSCPHLLGMSYPTLDADGKVQKDAPPQIARATIENGHLAEVSGVYDGATPGAMIGKARSLAADGQLTQRLTTAVERRYRVHLPEPSRRWAGVRIDGQTPRVPAPPATPPATGDRVAVEMRAVVEEQRLTHLVPAGASPGNMVRALAAERQRLQGLAEIGTAYRAELIAEALAEGLHAHGDGDGFAVDAYRALLQPAPLDTIKRMRDDWRAASLQRTIADQRTVRPSSRTGDDRTPRPPSRAYQC